MIDLGYLLTRGRDWAYRGQKGSRGGWYQRMSSDLYQPCIFQSFHRDYDTGFSDHVNKELGY